MSRYANVFYYYRGPSAKAAAGRVAVERQIEDNTTKALINVLQHADTGLSGEFIREFRPDPGTELLLKARPRFYLQGRPKQLQSEVIWLLGISVLGEIDSDSCAGPAGQRGRVDAAIHVPGEALVLIETKVIDRLDWQQLRRHAEDVGLPVLPCDASQWPTPSPWRLVRWSEVHAWATAMVLHYDRDAGQPTRFLLDQFIEYLELVGLAPFSGFRSEDFEFMAAPVELRTWERQAEVKARLAGLWEVLKERLGPGDLAKLGEVKVGTLPLGAKSAWSQTHAGAIGVNLTVELWADDLQLDLVAWQQHASALFRRWLQTDEAEPRLAALSPYNVVMFKRRAHKGPSGRPYWQRETFDHVDTVPASDVQLLREKVNVCEAGLDPQWEKLAFHLRVSWPRDEVVAAGRQIVEELLPHMLELAPMVPEINSVHSAEP